MDNKGIYCVCVRVEYTTAVGILILLVQEGSVGGFGFETSKFSVFRFFYSLICDQTPLSFRLVKYSCGKHETKNGPKYKS